jgi:hypothetical protein
MEPATCAESRRYRRMLWHRQDDIPKTAEERDAEIASLTRRRDRMLDSAPMSAIAGRLVLGLIISMTLISFTAGLVRNHFMNEWVLYGICGCLCLTAIYRFTRFPPISDRWAMSRLVGYDGDSPQDLQDRIDRLQAAQAQDVRSEP